MHDVSTDFNPWKRFRRVHVYLPADIKYRTFVNEIWTLESYVLTQYLQLIACLDVEVMHFRRTRWIVT